MYEKIQHHLANGGKVMVATYTRATVYDKRHVAMFKAGRAGEDGVYVARGKSWDYVMPQYLRFSRIAD